MCKVIVGRPVCGISINDELEFIQDDEGAVKYFDGTNAAKQYLKEHGMTKADMSVLTFIESCGTCCRCGAPLFKSLLPEYAYQCFKCDEDFYSFEQDKQSEAKHETSLKLDGGNKKMMLSEFVERTGFLPMADEYKRIEDAYCSFDGDKDAFCKSFVENGGIEKIYQARAAEIEQLRNQIEIMEKASKAAADQYEKDLAFIKAELDKELEWRPYEFAANVPQTDYDQLSASIKSGAAHYMSDDEALDWLCFEFGFERSHVTILHDIDEQEVNRHGHCRASGRKIDRRPIYCATDYHYIRFNTGRGEWQWEAWNGQIRPFYD